ncbi:CsgG/HfaB family protein [Pseudomonas sp. REP124]|uniref:CsgG/HfaB family protein n=1 Tax=Pseudomonas sp. REP124 TaxID=2875731 RepID=UPI001CCBFAC8|nr:CsgG/HfaB family protein [Pseudomonas sp. REP124]MBZ9781814.1 CsgG/HfaB family protein [Pseudomonas sp. REP124]
MSSIRNAEQTYRRWSSPILLELKEREHQLDPLDREALQNILLERRLINSGNPDGNERRKAGLDRYV